MRDRIIYLSLLLICLLTFSLVIYFDLAKSLGLNQSLTGFASIASLLGLLSSFIIIYMSYNIKYYLASVDLKRELNNLRTQKLNEIDALLLILRQKNPLDERLKNKIADSFNDILKYSRFLNLWNFIFIQFYIFLTSFDLFNEKIIIYGLNSIKNYYNGISQNEE